MRGRLALPKALVLAVAGALLVPGVALAFVDPSAALRTLVFDSRYAEAVDLLVFFLIFLGIAVRPLRERSGRPGVAVAVGFALLFSVSLAFTGRLHLLDFGPVAAAGIFVLLGAVTALGFHKLYESSWATAGAVGFAIAYSSARVVAPSLFLSAMQSFVIPTELVYGVAVVWLVYRFATQAFPADTGASWASHVAPTLASRGVAARERFRETAGVQEELSATATQEVHDHADILAELDETIHALNTRSPHEASWRDLVTNRLRELTDATRRVEDELERYRTLARRVTTLDLDEYANLKAALDALPETVKGEARKELRSLRYKLAGDERLATLARAVEANQAVVRAALEGARSALAAGHVKECVQALKEAVSAEREALRLSGQIRQYADKLKEAVAAVVTRAVTSQPALFTP